MLLVTLLGRAYVPVENKQDKLGTSVTLPMQSVISSVGLFPVGTCLLGPGGVTCRRDSEAQVSQSSQKVKSGD